MGFNNSSQSNQSFTDEQIQEEKNRIIKDLAYYSSKLDEARSESDKIISRKGEIDRLDREISEKKSILSDFEGQLYDISIQKTEKDQELNGLLNKITDSYQELEFVSGNRDNIEKDISRMRDEINEISMDKSRIDKEITDLEIKKFAALTENSETIYDLKKKVSDLTSDVELKTKLRSELNGEIDELKASYREIDSNIKEAKTKIDMFNTDLERIKNQTSESLNEAEESKMKMELMQLGKMQEWQEKENELSEREGNASIKESWLKEKEDALKLAKSDLEKFYNRPINHILF
jgi:chromosome segregation ATPase